MPDMPNMASASKGVVEATQPRKVGVSEQRPDRRHLLMFVDHYPAILSGGVAVVVGLFALQLGVMRWTTVLWTLGWLGLYGIHLAMFTWMGTSPRWRTRRDSLWGHRIRATLLALGVWGFTQYFVLHPDREGLSNGSLWLLYLMAVAVIVQRGKIVDVAGVIVLCFLLSSSQSQLWLEPTLWRDHVLPVAVECGWFALLSCVLYVFVRLLQEDRASLRLIAKIQDKVEQLSTYKVEQSSTHQDIDLPNEDDLLKECIALIGQDFEHLNVNILMADE